MNRCAPHRPVSTRGRAAPGGGSAFARPARDLAQAGISALEVLILASLLALLAAVIVPFVVRHERTTRAAEAMGELQAIYDKAMAHYAAPHPGGGEPCAGPGDIGTTPIQGTCCAPLGGPDADGDGRCDNIGADWDGGVWKTLGYRPADQHAFVYAFDSEHTATTWSFTITARGDLDCDGVASLYQRTVRGIIRPPAPNAGETGNSASPCVLVQPGEFVVERPLE